MLQHAICQNQSVVITSMLTCQLMYGLRDILTAIAVTKTIDRHDRQDGHACTTHLGDQPFHLTRYSIRPCVHQTHTHKKKIR